MCGLRRRRCQQGILRRIAPTRTYVALIEGLFSIGVAVASCCVVGGAATAATDSAGVDIGVVVRCPTPIWLVRSDPIAVARDPMPCARPTAVPMAPPKLRSRPLCAWLSREFVESSDAASPSERPSAPTADPPPPSTAPLLNSPRKPPASARPRRNAAPELVLGSTKANSLNKAAGATEAMRIKITPGNAVPIACSILSVRPFATPVVICTPSRAPAPSTPAQKRRR